MEQFRRGDTNSRSTNKKTLTVIGQYLKSRYPGIRAFEKEERSLFFGRTEEITRLSSMIKIEPLVVLFAKSGIGKTSLINAGVIPLLEKSAYFPIKIRFQDLTSSPVTTFKNTLAPFIDHGLLNRNVSKDKQVGPWEMLRSCQFKKLGNPLTPILIFDQFEEFFNHPTSEQNKLILDIADLISQRLPNRIQENLRSIPFRNRSGEHLSWHNPIKVQILIAIRSDKIGLLDNLSAEISGILQNRFHLKPLNRTSAYHAIVDPALLEERHFTSRPFQYEVGVLQNILDGLSNKNGEIESFQLQLLCQYIEKKVQELAQQPNNVIVTEQFFKHENGFTAALNTILNDYYENTLEDFSPSDRLKVSRFIEEGLIINGRRAGLTEGVEKETYQIDRQLLHKLMDSRLIRQENTHLGKSYEISHDTLVAPILDSYKQRKTIQEQETKALALKKERRRMFYALGLALVGFLLAVTSLLFYWQANEAKELAFKEQKKAEDALLRFKAKQLESTNDRYDRLISDGDKHLSQKDFTRADEAFQAALLIVDEYVKEMGHDSFAYKIDNRGETANERMKSASEKGESNARFNQLISEGTTLEERGPYFFVNALAKYKKAKQLNYNNEKANDLIKNLKTKLDVAYSKFVRDGDIFYKAKDKNGYRYALEKYQQALRIKRGNASLNAKIEDCKRQLR